jgi:hypothetical protein
MSPIVAVVGTITTGRNNSSRTSFTRRVLGRRSVIVLMMFARPFLSPLPFPFRLAGGDAVRV